MNCESCLELLLPQKLSIHTAPCFSALLQYLLQGLFGPDKPMRQQQGFLLHVCSIFCTFRLSIISFTTVLVAWQSGTCNTTYVRLTAGKNTQSPPPCHWAHWLGSPTAVPQQWVLLGCVPWDASSDTQLLNKGAVVWQAPRCCSQQTVIWIYFVRENHLVYKYLYLNSFLPT